MTYFSRQDLYKGLFGELVTADLTPTIQIANQYEIDPSLRNDLEVFEATGGTADNNGNMFRCQSGTSVGGYGVIRSNGAARYRPGEAILGRFTAKFTTGIASSLQLAGFFSLTESLAFGYDGASFGIIHEYDGKAEIQELEVTGAATSAANCTVTLDGDAVNIALTVSTVQTNAWEIKEGLEGDPTVSGKWRVEQVDDKVFIIAKDVGNKTGTMSFAAGSTGATATLTEAVQGQSKSSGNVAQASWNIQTAPFSGYDPTQFNVYQIEYGYLGAVGPLFSVYDPLSGEFIKVHQIPWANTNATPVFGNPDMQIGWTAASLGSSGTNLTIEGASAMASVEGAEVIQNTSFALNNTKSSIGTTLTNLITVKNRLVYGKRFNLGRILPLAVSVDNDHNKSCVVEIYKNATLGGTPNFQYKDAPNSLVTYDTAGTTVTNGTLIDTFTVAAASADRLMLAEDKILLLPDETLTIAVRVTSGTATNTTGTFTWLEEK